MRLSIEREVRSDENQQLSFASTFRIVPDQPVPRSVQYLADVPLEELARQWFLLQERGSDQDQNAVLVSQAENWAELTVRDLVNRRVRVVSRSPIVANAVEERFRRALALLTLSDSHDESFLREREAVLDVPSEVLRPTGTAAGVKVGSR